MSHFSCKTKEQKLIKINKNTTIYYTNNKPKLEEIRQQSTVKYLKNKNITRKIIGTYELQIPELK